MPLFFRCSKPRRRLRDVGSHRALSSRSKPHRTLFSVNTSLQSLQTYLIESVQPFSEVIDQDSALLKQAFYGLAERGWLGACIPASLGGLGLNKIDYHNFKKTLARYSGALTFLQTQHQTAAQLIQTSPNASLKSTYLSQMAKGERLVGMALSPHLANWQKPSVAAIKQKDGLLIPKATIRMATGYDFFHDLIIGFVVEENNQPGYEVTAFIPFQASQRASGGKILYSAPLPLLAAQSTNTVSIEIENWLIPYEQVLTENALGSFAAKSLTRTNLDSFLAGIVAALLDLMALTYPPSIATHSMLQGYEAFEKQLALYEQMIAHREKHTPAAPIRAVGLELCDACIAFARQVLRGRIMIKNDPVNKTLRRLEHERDLYAVVTAYNDLLEATLKQQMKHHAVLFSTSEYLQNPSPFSFKLG